ncbi:restriction endonuclease subunit S [Pseudoalteromonas piscicida]|nr:restriction endonuclease subunit S [Pseudoalteromonas piscicida]
MPKYETYKDSGFEWIGDIPEHWQVVPLKRVVKEHSGNGFPIELQGGSGDIPFLKVSDFGRDNIYVGNGANMVSSQQVKKYRWNLIPPGSLVTAKIGEALRKNHRKLTKISSVIDNNCIAFECRNINSMFNFYLHKVVDFDWFVNPGAVPSISVPKYKSLKVALPSEQEQTAIANFLDKKTAQIDEAIAIKEKQIELLKERKQIIIQKAVTQGMNQDVSLKESGIDWVGKVPKHWKIVRFKNLFTQSKLPIRERDGVVTSFRDGEVTLRSNRRLTGYTEAIIEGGYQGIRKGQLVLNSMDAFEGAIGVSDSDGKCTPEYVICDPKNKEINQYYFAYLLREMALAKYIQVICNAVRQRAVRIRFNNLASRFMVVPPHNEQTQIVEYIKTESEKIDVGISSLKHQIEKLKEYKATLINSAVTGKIKVPEVDSKLS